MQVFLRQNNRRESACIELRSALDFDTKAQQVLHATFPGRCVSLICIMLVGLRLLGMLLLGLGPGFEVWVSRLGVSGVWGFGFCGFKQFAGLGFGGLCFVVWGFVKLGGLGVFGNFGGWKFWCVRFQEIFGLGLVVCF